MSILEVIAQKGYTIPAIKAKPSPSKLSLYFVISSEPLLSMATSSNSTSSALSALAYYWVAITMTAVKQRTIPMTSIGFIGSLSRQHAMIEVQNGLVYQKTIINAKGAKGVARLKSTKLAWPVKQRQNKAHFFSLGKSVIGLKPMQQHQRLAAMRPVMFRMRLNSAG